MNFVIKGEPHPQGRPRCRKLGNYAQPYEAPKDKKWKTDARKQIISQLSIDGQKPVFRSGIPLKVRIVSVFGRPKSDHRKRDPKQLEWHVKKKDIDNIAKAVLDAATGVLWADDAQVSIMICEKHLGAQDDKPRTTLSVEPIDIEPHETWGV